jgi:hypothetical protein
MQRLGVGEIWKCKYITGKMVISTWLDSEKDKNKLKITKWQDNQSSTLILGKLANPVVRMANWRSLIFEPANIGLRKANFI